MFLLTKKIIIPLVVLGSFALGLVISPYIFPSVIPLSKEVRASFNYKFINPLLECDISSISQNPNFPSLRNSIQSVIDQETSNNDISSASVYYRDLNNGPWFGVNEKEDFSPASLIKVPVMIAFLKEAEGDTSVLQRKILNTKTYDYSQQNVLPSQTMELSKEYTIEDLINRMIIYSDNAAYELLLENIDNNKIFSVYKDLGVDISKAQQDPAGDILNNMDYATFFRVLFNASYLDQDMSEKALGILSKSQYTQGLVSGVPGNVIVAHKFGERQFLPSHEKQLHDCGIVYLPKKPYLLCIMSRSSDFNKAAKFISETSKAVYDVVSTSNNQ